MSQTDFARLLPRLHALPPEDVRGPGIPVGQAFQEAEDLYHQALEDREALQGAGLDWALVEGLPEALGAARYAQAQWRKEAVRPRVEQQIWKETEAEGRALLQELAHHLLFALRGNEARLRWVRRSAKADSSASLAQSLSDLSIGFREHEEDLRAIGVGPEPFERAAQLCSVLSRANAVATGERLARSPNRDLRDRAYTHLHALVSEIRATGRYVFWKEPQRAKAYASEYRRRHRRKGETGALASAVPGSTLDASS